MTTPPNGQSTTDPPKEGIDGAYLMRTCAGGIVQVFQDKLTPEKLAAVAQAARAYAALEQNVEIQELKQQLEQLQNDMKLLAMGSAKRIA